ncbi:MAG TPA: peptide deformylase [Planctomycetota bacterium]|jgi:peptide deformylase|nr:peptide deformylase [Planctomycetota bacterium]
MARNLEFEVVLYPGPILRKVSDPVAHFDEELRATVGAMFARMRKSKGVGLAAPQVGLQQRILVLNPSEDEKNDLVLVNPSIVARAGERVVFDEGCLSFPGIYAEITRPDRCTVRAYDLSGELTEREYAGFASRIIQHEYDHLEGVLLVDRMTPAEKLKHKSALEELVTRYKRARPADAAAQAAAQAAEREAARRE